MSRRRQYAVIAVAAWTLGLCWALSSPVGSSPDDNYHLTSIYCAGGDEAMCTDLDGAGSGVIVEVPAEAVLAGCYAFNPEQSGACADAGPDDVATNDHHNYAGQYPPTFYSVMGLFAGPDVERSVLIMRVVALTVALFAMGLALWATAELRDSQIVAWSVAAIPLGMFLLPSTNPSSWGIAGVAAMWPASYALMHSESRKQSALAGAACLLAAVLATSRGDTAGLAAGVLGLVLLIYARSRIQLVPSILGAALIVFLGLTLLSSGQSESLGTGLPGAETSSGVALWWSNLLHLPELWAGSFGVNWGLGWLDTVMPGAVWVPALMTASGLVFLGITKVGVPKGLLLTAFGAVIFLYPFLMLQLSGAVVGTQFQPRYVLPMIFVFMGVALAPLDGLALKLTAPQRWVLTCGTLIATSVALHVELRRYVTGDDVSSPNLNAQIEWSYTDLLSPMTVWVIGTVAAGALFFVVIRLISASRSDEDSFEPVPPARSIASAV